MGRKNVFIKSMLRQPIRAMLLVLLMAAASFAFVMRAVEYIVVNDRISEISALFQTVGVLSHRDGITADASEAIEFIAESPYVSFYDRRRGFEGTLVDMHNAYIEGSRYLRASWVYRHFRDNFLLQEYINLMPRLRPMDGFAGFVSGDSFFYGELLYIEHIYQPPVRGPRNWVFTPHKLLTVQVDQVLQGYPERLYEGQILRLRMDFPYVGFGDSPLANMEIGQRYFLKGTFYWMLDSMQLDSRIITKYMQPLGDVDVWYIPVEPSETVDTAALGLCRQLEFARHVQSAVHLRTTKDMVAMPSAQEDLGLLSLIDGRFVDMDDYLNARPVVAIHRHFAQRRQIGVGDTITINVNADQHLVYSPYYIIGNTSDTNPTPEPIMAFPELGVLSIPDGYPSVTLVLEVVGIFDLIRWWPVNTGWSSINKFMFIPDSLLSADWGMQSAYFGDIAPGYAPVLWYSFMLNDPRDQVNFLWDTREILADMGFRASFVGRDGSGFWAAADTILMSTTLNVVMFSVLLILVLVFTVALFMWQRNREYAILRALGCPAKSVFAQSTAALLLFGLPAVAAGSAAGWFFSLRLAEDSIAGFGEIVTGAVTGARIFSFERDELLAYYMEAALPSVNWLIALCAIILAVVLVLVAIGSLRAARRSILEMLRR